MSLHAPGNGAPPDDEDAEAFDQSQPGYPQQRRAPSRDQLYQNSPRLGTGIAARLSAARAVSATRSLSAGAAAGRGSGRSAAIRSPRSGRWRSSPRRRSRVRWCRQLDRWIMESIQPAAMRWFNQPVVEIRQISAYSCRGMNGNPERAHLRACVRQCARHLRLHARRRPAHLGEGWLARPAGRAGLSARHPGRGLPAVQHRAGAGLERLSLRPHPCGPDAPLLRPRDLQSGGGVGRGDRRARRRRVMRAAIRA